MKKSEIHVGGYYVAKVGGKLTTVRVDVIREEPVAYVGPYTTKTMTWRYDVTNLTTGRKTTFRSAAKFRGVAVPKSRVVPCGKLLPGGIYGCSRPADHSGLCNGDSYDNPRFTGRGQADKVSEVKELARPEATADRLLEEEQGDEQRPDPSVAVSADGTLGSTVSVASTTCPRCGKTVTATDGCYDYHRKPSGITCGNSGEKVKAEIDYERAAKATAEHDARQEGEQGPDPMTSALTTTGSSAPSAVPESSQPATPTLSERSAGDRGYASTSQIDVPKIAAQTMTGGLASRIAAVRAGREAGSPVAGMVPNEEQEEVLTLAASITMYSGRVIVVSAGAGTGKTALLKMLSKILHGKGQGTAFNTSLVNDNKPKFDIPWNTTHSLAFRAVGKQYQHRLGGERMRSEQVARILGIEPLTVILKGAGPVEVDQQAVSEADAAFRADPTPENRTALNEATAGKPTDKEKVLRAEFLAGQVLAAIKRFCQSADREIGERHLHYIVGIDSTTEHENNDLVRDYLLPYCARAWADLSNVNGQLPYQHDCYVKSWQLGTGDDRPIITADYIMIDESQDSAPVFLDIIKQQTHALIVLVGDENQQIYCQPAGTKILTTTRTGRGEWAMEEVPIENIEVGDHVVSYRQSWRLGRLSTKGCSVSSVAKRIVDEELVVVSAAGCESRYTTDHHCVVMLGDACLGKWVVYMQRKGEFYRVGACAGVYASQGNTIGPLVRAKQEGADDVWILSEHTSKRDALDHEQRILQSFPGRCFQSSGGEKWWEYQLSNEGDAASVLHEHGKDISQPLLRRSGKWVDKTRTPIVTAARNLLDGMRVLPRCNVPYSAEDRGYTVMKSQWVPIYTSMVHYQGEVYSISVDGDHTYIADGIVTHNSWRGAVDAMKAYPDAERRLLSQSYRFGQAIADVANTILAELDEPTDLVMRGMPTIPSRVDTVTEPRCYLYRTNAGAVGRVMAAITANKRPHLIGGGDDVVRWMQAAMDLQARKGTRHPELCCFDSWSEVVEYSKTDEGGDLRLMVKLVTDFGAMRIRDALKNMPKEDDADLVVSTAHKSKGREWDTVRLGQDFPTVNKMGDAERRLLYVAATRAKLTLDVSECPTFCGGMDHNGGNVDGSGGGWVPGLRIEYTAPMLSAEEQAAGIGARGGTLPTTTTTPPTNGKLAQERPAWTWGKWGDRWCLRGPRGTAAGTKVDVSKKDGRTSRETVGVVVKEFATSDAALYGVSG